MTAFPALDDAARAMSELRGRLSGQVCTDGDPDYPELATPWNLAVQARPFAVVEAADADDVVEAVRFARGAGLPVAVQATGHGISADLADVLLVNTRRLDECRVHPDGWARVGAGVRWQQVLEAAAPHGLAPLCGSSPDVSVVGYTTGGGLGPLARTYGAASDRVRAIELVTGDGSWHRTTPDLEPDLFWGLRGGKGALGVVTAIEFDLLPIPEVYGGALYFDGAHAGEVLHAWREWCADLPAEATTSVALLRLPPLPGVPEPLAGRPTLSLRFVWVGDPAVGEGVVAPMRAVAEPLMDAVQTIPYQAIGMVHADPVDPMPYHETCELLTGLPAAAVDALLAVAGPGAESPQVIVELRQLGGALAEESARPSALSHRDAAFSLLTIGVPMPEPGPVAEHAEAVRRAVEPWLHGGGLPNFGHGCGPDRMARTYDVGTLARLTALARRFDPDHVFRVGQVPHRSMPATSADLP